MLERAEKLGRLLENAFLSALLLGMIGLGVTQIGLRWAGAGSFSWADEAIRLMVLWIAMIAGIAAAREDRHIAIDVLSRFFPPRGKAWVAIVVDMFTAAVCVVLARYSYTMVSYAYEDGDVLLGGLPAWWFQAILPIGFALIAYRYFLWIGKRITALLGRSELP